MARRQLRCPLWLLAGGPHGKYSLRRDLGLLRPNASEPTPSRGSYSTLQSVRTALGSKADSASTRDCAAATFDVSERSLLMAILWTMIQSWRAGSSARIVVRLAGLLTLHGHRPWALWQAPWLKATPSNRGGFNGETPHIAGCGHVCVESIVLWSLACVVVK